MVKPVVDGVDDQDDVLTDYVSFYLNGLVK